MDFRRLAALVAVADHGSFSAAARALHTVQSNISTHVARLESELGVELIDRKTGDLTRAGHTVLDRARRIQSEIEALEHDVASLSDEIVGRVRLGMIGTTARWLGAHILAEASQRHPKVTLVIHDGTTSALLPRLLSDDLDLCALNLPIQSPDVATDPLFQEDTILVVPGEHELAGRTEVGLAELADHPLLLAAPGNALRDQLDAAARLAGVDLTAKAEIDGLRLIASLAFGGYGAAILPASAATGSPAGDWVSVDIVDRVRRSVGIARRKRARLSAPATAIAGLLVDVVAERSPLHDGIQPARPGTMASSI